jgi:IclR family transcriptional regulator, acetate operon repressor
MTLTTKRSAYATLEVASETPRHAAQIEHHLSSIGRAATLLRCFTHEDESLRLVDFMQRTGMPKTTIHRVVGRLVSEGLLKRSTVGFQLGLPLFELGQLASRQLGIREVALPAIRQLRQMTGLITHLAVLDAGEVLFLEKLGDDRNRLRSRAGGRLPASCTALGKAMLAFAPTPDAINAIRNRPNRLTPYSIVSPGLFMRELATVAQTCVAFDREESQLGVTCAASPIFGSAGKPVAALSVSRLGTRLDFAQTGAIVHTAANAVSRALGGESRGSRGRLA